jgi:lipoprotein-anchoring transpeptidase ErfK/SrfK
MIRTVMAAALTGLFSLAVISVSAEAATSSDDQKQLVVKKKKIAAVDKKQIKITRKKTDDAAAPGDRKVATKRSCGTFVQCLFGRKSGTRPRDTNTGTIFGSFQSAGLSKKSSRREVDWTDEKYAVGSLVVKTPERALYYVTGPGEAIRYSVGVGREGFQWSGNSRIVSKAEWPDWTPPQEMIEREAAKGVDIPDFMEGGPGNPLGARALYIGGTIFRVHGTNNESSIGGAVSSGCIRMMNADVIDLYSRVKIGSKIYVYQ